MRERRIGNYHLLTIETHGKELFRRTRCQPRMVLPRVRFPGVCRLFLDVPACLRIAYASSLGQRPRTAGETVPMESDMARSSAAGTVRVSVRWHPCPSIRVRSGYDAVRTPDDLENLLLRELAPETRLRVGHVITNSYDHLVQSIQGSRAGQLYS